MVESNLFLILLLFFFMAVLYVISQRIKVSSPILLVIGGLLISLIPGVPTINIDPDIVFLIFLPPLLFEAAWYTSWNRFWKWRRSIFSMGFGLVFFTSLAIAYFSLKIIPDFTLALGFLLGGIISPPDAVAAQSVLKGMKIPKKAMTVLEGESLVNDAASLTVFKFALIAILTGTFSMQKAVSDFFILSVMGIVVGLVIGHILYFILRFVAKSSSITTPITLLAPYLMYLSAEHFHWSGVLAVVSGGLFLSFRSKDYLNYHTRIQTKEVLETMGFLLNGFVFILIGLELPVIVSGLGEYSKGDAIQYALMITGIIIVLRIILVYLADYLPRLLSKKIRQQEQHADWKTSFVIGWAGMRGVVSLASALAIPLTLDNGMDFPHRNLILFITFVVILITLVFQGLTLPLIIKKLKFKDDEEEGMPAKEQLETIQLSLAKLSLLYIEGNYAKEIQEIETIKRLRDQYIRSITLTEQAKVDNTKEALGSIRGLHNKILLELITLKRKNLHNVCSHQKFDDDIIKEIEYNLDLEESRLQNN